MSTSPSRTRSPVRVEASGAGGRFSRLDPPLATPLVSGFCGPSGPLAFGPIPGRQGQPRLRFLPLTHPGGCSPAPPGDFLRERANANRLF